MPSTSFRSHLALRLRVRLGSEDVPVESVRLTIDVSYKSASFEPEEGQHHLYEGMDGAVAQHSRFTGKMFGLPVTFDHQKTVTEPPTASVQFPSGLRMNTIWAGVGPSTLDALSRGVDSDSRTVKAVCHFCSQEGEIQIRPVLPDYLQPTKEAA